MAANTKFIGLLVLSACVVAALAAPEAKPVSFVAKNIVANITTDCPVKNVPFAKSEFDVEELPSLMEVLQKGQVSQKCQEDAVSLMGCYSDGSLGLRSGCCAKECADSIEKSISSGCFTEYAKAVCTDKDAKKKFLAGLTNAGTRCANYKGSCEEIMAGKMPTKGNSTATKDDAAAPAAAPAAAAAPAKSSALHAAASALLPLAAGAAALLAL